MDEHGGMAAVRRTALLPAPPEAVWAALTEAGRLSAWLGGEVDVDPFPGGQIVVNEDGRLRRGVIAEFDPLRHLEIRWLPASPRLGFIWGPDDAPAGSGGAVEFWLQPVPESPGCTYLTVVERAPLPSQKPAALARA